MCELIEIRYIKLNYVKFEIICQKESDMNQCVHIDILLLSVLLQLKNFKLSDQ